MITSEEKVAMGRWLWPVIFLALCASSVVSEGLKKTAPAEKEALLAFKRALHDRARILRDWSDSTDPCNDRWTGVFCVKEDLPPDIDPKCLHITEVRILNRSLGGKLVPELGNLTAIKFFDVLGNLLKGTIPRELGKLTNLFALTLSGNEITGAIPDEFGNLVNLNRLQLDENKISGKLPASLSKMVKLQHMHLNNNSLEGAVPKEYGQLPIIVHILLDNNQLSGKLPKEIANISELVILQLDNNKFEGVIPPEYGNMTKLTKLSCRNCGLSGTIPDLKGMSRLAVLDLSRNNFNGPIPPLITNNITSIDLSNNRLRGQIPDQLLSATILQFLSLANNKLEGYIPSFEKRDYSNFTRVLDFQNNSFNYISLPMVATAVDEPNFDIRLSGNVEICEGSGAILEISYLCRPKAAELEGQSGTGERPRGDALLVGYRLKSPGFFFFTKDYYAVFIAGVGRGLGISSREVKIQWWEWEPGPRLHMLIVIQSSHGQFNESEIFRIQSLFAHWEIKNNTVFGPYELLGFDEFKEKDGVSKAATAGIVVGSVVAVTFLALGVLLLRTLQKRWRMSPAEKRRQRILARTPKGSMIKVAGLQAYTYKEMDKATNGFSEANQVGRGGYGTVYRGTLEDGTVVAIKKALEGALQRNGEQFANEIEMLSRCHHRNLVSLIGFCLDEDEQMLVYEFMEGGTLQENLKASASTQLDFAQRLRIALGSARGILYLHTEANPPIYHRDIKATNILLNEKKEAKVADFGLSRLAPVPDAEGATLTHVSTVVKGTPGYLDPEYFQTHQLTEKSDVYSFGVVLLELLTGLQPISNGKNIVREVKLCYNRGELLEIVDKRLGTYPPEIIESFAKLAIACVSSEIVFRPSMQEVCHELEGLMKSLSGDTGPSSTSRSSGTSREFFRPGEFPFQISESGSTHSTDFLVDGGHNSFFEPMKSRYYRILSR